MDLVNDRSSVSLPRTIIIQSESSRLNSKSNKLIFRLGWISFILGFCAFLLHYISSYHLENFSPINAGIISGFFLMIAGLASVAAAYKEKSYRCFIHAQIWSFIANIILAPGIIAVSVTALIVESEDINPLCQPHISYTRTIFLGGLEKYSMIYPCLESAKLFYLTLIVNTIQLIIGVICFVVHMFLLSMQRKVIKKMQIKRNDPNHKFIVYTQPIMTNQSKKTCFEGVVFLFKQTVLVGVLH